MAFANIVSFIENSLKDGDIFILFEVHKTYQIVCLALGLMFK